MKLYPMMAKLENCTVLVVGGGRVATRKVRTLLGTGAAIRVISPSLTTELRSLISEKAISGHQRSFSPSDLKDVSVVFAATDDPTLNETIAREAKARGIPVNDITHPELCAFFVPSLIRRGDLILAISSSGKSPATTKWLRKRLEREIGPEYETLVRWMGTIRDYLLKQGYTNDQIRTLCETLLNEDLLASLKTNEKEKLTTSLKRAFKSALNVSAPLPLIQVLGLQ